MDNGSAIDQGVANVLSIMGIKVGGGDMVEKPIGWHVNIHTRDWAEKMAQNGFSVFIPFVCKRCGECCRKIGVSLCNIDVAAAAKYLNVTEKEVVEGYTGKVISCDEEKIEYEKSSVLRLPCPFLRGNECLIYPVRPFVCAAFPVGTRLGDHGIGCPGKREATRALRAVKKGLSYTKTPPTFEPKVCQIPPERWDKILAKYLRSNPSKEALKLFLKFNRPTVRQH